MNPLEYEQKRKREESTYKQYILLLALLNTILCILVLKYIGFSKRSVVIEHESALRKVILALAYFHIVVYGFSLVLLIYWFLIHGLNENEPEAGLMLSFKLSQDILLLVFYGWVVWFMRAPQSSNKVTTLRRLAYICLFFPLFSLFFAFKAKRNRMIGHILPIGSILSEILAQSDILR